MHKYLCAVDKKPLYRLLEGDIEFKERMLSNKMSLLLNKSVMFWGIQSNTVKANVCVRRVSKVYVK